VLVHLCPAVPTAPKSAAIKVISRSEEGVTMIALLPPSSKRDFPNLAAKHSFKIDAIKPMVFDSYYVSMLSEKYKGGTFFNAIINGLISNIKAFKNINNSSLIYILSKNSK